MSSRILVIEDDPTVLSMLDLVLSLEGFEVVLASNGPDGLASVAEQAPDAILLDVMMPGMDGFNVADRLRADGATDGIPILFVTARVEADFQWAGWQHGGSSYVTKPFDNDELIREIHRVIDKGSALRNTMATASQSSTEHLLILGEASL